MLYYEMRGDRTSGRPLLLLHGFLESHSMWDYLRLTGCTLAVDLPGHGKSALSGIDSMQAMAEQVMEVLQAENITEYDAIGHSMGGYVALMLAEMDVRCQKIILMNSNVWADTEEKKADRRRVAQLVQTKKGRFVAEAIPNLFDMPEIYPDVVSALIDEAKNISAEAIARASIAMAERKDWTEEMYAGAINAYVIQGLKDPIANATVMRGILSEQSERYFEVDTGHMAYIEATSEVEAIIEAIRNRI